MDGKKEGCKDGTKTDNGICIQTMPTRNYFIFLWNLKLTLRILFQLSRKTLRGEALAKFLGKARFGHYEFNGRGPMLSEAFVWPKNRFKVFSPNWVLVILLPPHR